MSATVRKFHVYEKSEIPNIRKFSAYENILDLQYLDKN